MTKPLVSIVTSTYNSAETVSKAMESVLNQTYSNIEYIIADGASTDNTLDIVESYRKKFIDKGIELKVITGPDSGIYGGMNKGIAKAQGELIGLVNSDDWYEPTIVEEIVNRYNETNFDMCYCDMNIVKGNNDIIVKKTKRMKYYYTTRRWNHPTTFITKKIYDKRMYDETFKYYADWDLMLWIFKHYENIQVINKSLSNFRLGGRTTSKSFKVTTEKVKERYRAYRNNKCSMFYIFECLLMDFCKELFFSIKK